MNNRVLLSTISFMAICAGAFSVEENSAALFPVIQNGKWGYIDKIGKMVITPQYDCAWDFSEGLAAVQVGAYRGFIDEKGAMVVKPEYAMTRAFSEGKGAVYVGAGKFGRIVDLRTGGSWKFIDRSGKILFEKANKSFAMVEEFHDGEARVKFIFNGHMRSSLINSNGYVREFVSKNVGRTSEGLAAWPMPNKLYGYVDRQAKEVIAGEFDVAGDFSDGLARVRKNKKWSFIDRTGKKAFEGEFDDARDFSAGLAAVALTNRWGCIDHTGKLVVDLKFDFVAPYSEGLARFVAGGKHGFMDATGKVVIDPIFDGGWEFSKGLARVVVDQKEGYVDKTGKYVWEPKESPYTGK